MPDDKHITEPRDRKEINIHEDYERKAWAKKLGVTEAELIAAVKAVGPMAHNVAAHLGKKL